MGVRVAFLGLGVMGFEMAGHLAKSGYDVSVFNRTQSKARAWSERFGGRVAESPAAAAEGAAVIFMCVGNDDDVRAVSLGVHGALAGMDKNALLVDHTTASAQLARELFELAEGRGLGFLDAPVSGGQTGAQKGTLTVMCGGTEEAFLRAKPYIECYAKAVKRMGPAGSGQLAKMVNQICIAGVLQGLSEGIHFALRAGLDVPALIDVISKGAAQSWQMENRALSMAEGRFDFGFAVDWMRKDLAICLEEARKNGATLPLTALVDQFYAEVQAAGGQRLDTSSLITRLSR